MSNDDYLTVCLAPQTREAVENNITHEPDRIALDKKIPDAAVVASLVKTLQKARTKLPSYFAVRCIIPPLAFEQSSSERTAFNKSGSGGLCVDITCGLGVDAFALSKRFDKVIAVERDQTLARITSENFRRLGAENIEVVNSTAEEWLQDAIKKEVRADMIFVDPDRRGADGKRKSALEDCSPNVVALMPDLLKIAPRIAIKASPLLDTDEIFRIFEGKCSVEVVSLDGEVKEVIIEVVDGCLQANETRENVSGNSRNGTNGGPTIGVTIINNGGLHIPESESNFERGVTSIRFPAGTAPQYGKFSPPYIHMIIPDPALRKARMVGNYYSGFIPQTYAVPPSGYLLFNRPESWPLAEVWPPDKPLAGKLFEVEAMLPYNPKALAQKLKKNGIKTIQAYTHYFPATAAEICSKLKVREGNGPKLAFIRIGRELWSIELKEIYL